MNNLDYQKLDRDLDRVKTEVFTVKNAGFLAPLMSSVNFLWTEDIKTAQTNGISLYWNPHWFQSLVVPTRKTVLVHELWHVGFLHMLRCGTREPKIWNWACDLFINNMLYYEGYTFDGVYPWLNDDINRWRHKKWRPVGNYAPGTSAEEIYDILYKMPSLSIDDTFVWGHEEMEPDGKISGDDVDIIEPPDPDGAGGHAVANKVITSVIAAKAAGEDTGLPGDVETVLKKFLQPKLPWEVLLMQFFTALFGSDYTWARPNRRHRDIYLPSLQEDDNGLECLAYYLDVSGSVSDGEVTRFNSEVKYIKETFNPKKLILVLFDDKIQREYEFTEDDEFEEVIIVGRGGTELSPVREHMLKLMPTAAIIFSDLYCDPMEPLPQGVNIPTIWVGVNARQNSRVNFGKLIHIKE